MEIEKIWTKGYLITPMKTYRITFHEKDISNRYVQNFTVTLDEPVKSLGTTTTPVYPKPFALTVVGSFVIEYRNLGEICVMK